MRLVLKAAFDRFSGYGNDAVDMAVVLEKIGVDVTVMPTTITPGLPREFTRLLEKDPVGPKDVLLHYAPPWLIKPWNDIGVAPKAVGYTMWERTPLTMLDFDEMDWDSQDATNRLCERRAWDGMDLLLVTCPMNVEAFRNVDTVTPIKVAPGGIVGDDWPMTTRSPAGRPMTFLMVGMLAGSRKDPFLMLDAWREVKQENPDFDGRLILHTIGRGLHPGIENAYPDVTISTRALDRKGLVDLYHGADVMVSVSRGEGCNKPALEFMATGGTVMASDWSGHQNWLHRDVTYALPGTLQPIGPGYPGVSDFRVSKEALKETILRAWREPSEVARRGERAAKWVREIAEWEGLMERLVRTLEQA